MLDGQPTSIVLSIISAAAILFSATVLVRVRVLPLWSKVVGALLAIYGVTAFVLAIKSGTPYVQLFHGGSEWKRLPILAARRIRRNALCHAARYRA